MDIHGPEFAAFMELGLSPSGLRAARDIIMSMIDDPETVRLVDWLFTAIVGSPTEIRPDAILSPADALYLDALLSMIEMQRRAEGDGQPHRFHALPVEIDFLSANHAERVWSPIKLLNFFYRYHYEPKRGAAIVTSVRNEGINLVEWIAHHRLLGFEDFFFYVNDSDDGTVELLTALADQKVCHLLINETNLGVVGQSAFPIQAKAFEHAIHFLTPLREFKWVLFSDVDEFLITKPIMEFPTRERPLDELLQILDSDPNSPSAVLFSWKWFGSNAAYAQERGLNFERFQNLRGSDHLKTLARLSRCLMFSSSHLPNFIAQSCLLDGSLKAIPEVRLQMPAAYQYGQINHYWNKSFEEFVAKKIRGRSYRSFDDFFVYGNNRSFGRVEVIPEIWIERVKREFHSLRLLRGVEDHHREAHSKFLQLLRENANESEFLDLYIKGRFGADSTSQAVSNETVSQNTSIITLKLKSPQNIVRLPLLEGTDQFAAPWMAHWHEQTQIPLTDEPFVRVIESAMVDAVGNLHIDGKPLRDKNLELQQTNLPIREVSDPCIVIEGYTGKTYGRDILDWVLRVWLARLGADQRGLTVKVLLDSSAPTWVANLLKDIAEIPIGNIEQYDPLSERVLLHQAVISCAPLSSAGFHSVVNEIVEHILELRPNAPDTSPKRLFLTQGAVQGTGARDCLNEDELVNLAVSQHGFTPVEIKTSGWLKQIELFRGAEIIVVNTNNPIGSMIFAPPGARVALLAFRDLLPSQIGTLRGHRNAYFMQRTESSSRFLIDHSRFGEFLNLVTR